MKRLLYISAFPPNKKSGGQNFSLNTIKDLSNYYKIDLIYFEYPNHNTEVGKEIKVIATAKPSLINCLFSLYLHPVFSRRFSPRLLKLIKKIADNYDVIYFDYIQCAAYSMYLDHPRKIIRCHDILWQKYSREKSKLFSWIAKGEKQILNSATKVLVPSEKDAKCVNSKYGIKSDFTNEYLEYYRFDPQIKVTDDLILFGLWSRYENMEGLNWFMESVYTKYRDSIKCKIKIMGGGMPNEFKNKYVDDDNVVYLGYVEDSYSEIVKCRAMIVPLFQGAGIKIKVLDSFSTGTPVIGTDLAFEGLSQIQDLTYVANTPDEFIQMIVNLKQSDIPQKIKNREKFIESYGNKHVSDCI